jgi:tagaturonate epimerase
LRGKLFHPVSTAIFSIDINNDGLIHAFSQYKVQDSNYGSIVMRIEKYSMGVGDRFGHQGVAQLKAFIEAEKLGIDVVPVWNKSNREHGIIGTSPRNTRLAADTAVAGKWRKSYYVDADHINLNNVDDFIESSDFFTLDVADYTGKPASNLEIESFVKRHNRFSLPFEIDGISGKLSIEKDEIAKIAGKYLYAVKEAARIYKKIESIKGAGNFVTEVSMDETDQPQTPLDMLFILAAIADEGIPAQTIAPKFTGRFNKGVDYEGDLSQFEQEFNDDLAVVRFAVNEFSLPKNLKLSIHSGSDKFSIYESIRKAVIKYDAGLHVKTAGTTWLEELIGLAESGESGLDIAKEIYCKSLDKFDALCAPYATVIKIDKSRLPAKEEVSGWDGSTYAATLRHDQSCRLYNPNVRQLLHVGYKVAADMGARYLNALEENAEVVGRNVTDNILNRHLIKLFAVS